MSFLHDIVPVAIIYSDGKWVAPMRLRRRIYVLHYHFGTCCFNSSRRFRFEMDNISNLRHALYAEGIRNWRIIRTEAMSISSRRDAPPSVNAKVVYSG